MVSSSLQDGGRVEDQVQLLGRFEQLVVSGLGQEDAEHAVYGDHKEMVAADRRVVVGDERRVVLDAVERIEQVELEIEIEVDCNRAVVIDPASEQIWVY